MYAVVQTGGKQYRVSEGETLEVERLGDPGDSVSLRPVLLVDGKRILSKPSELASVSIDAIIQDEHRGKKIHGFKYKNKSNQRRRWGHRQTLATIEITAIKAPKSTSAKAADKTTDKPTKTSPAKTSTAKTSPAKTSTAKTSTKTSTAKPKASTAKTTTKASAAKSTSSKTTKASATKPTSSKSAKDSEKDSV